MSTPKLGDWDDSDPPLVYRSWRTVCCVSFLIYAAMGSALPMLSLFLRTSAAMPWWQVSTIFAALALGSAIALPLIQFGQRRHYDPRLGTALGQLLCSAVAMAVVICSQNKLLIGADWRIAASLALVAGVLFAWTLSWLHELAGQTAPANPRASREWRLWGAVGFVLPAWCVELAVGRITSVVWEQFEVLFSISAWIGIAAVAVLVIAWQQETSVKPVEIAAAPNREKTTVGGGLLGAVIVVAVLQRWHEFLVVPFIEQVLEQHSSVPPLSLRLSVVPQVAEVATLYALGRVIWLIGVRLSLVTALAVWLFRCLLLGAIAQTPMGAREALTGLFIAQVCGGIATALFAGTAAFAVSQQLKATRLGMRRLVVWSGVVAALALVLIGHGAQVALEKLGAAWAQRFWEALPERVTIGGYVLILRQWSGLWFASSVLPLAALPLVLVARLQGRDDQPSEKPAT